MMTTRLIQSLHIFNQYIKNHRQIGTISPDSITCVNGLLEHVPFASADLIIEFGAATGTVSREILRRKRSGCTLICFEKNLAFHRLLSKTIAGPNLYIVQGDVFDAPDILSARFGIRDRTVDCIVSTLPCSSMPYEKLLHTAIIPLLKENGLLVQYMHVISFLKGYRLRPILMKHFRRIHSVVVVRNLPPALIYNCR